MQQIEETLNYLRLVLQNIAINGLIINKEFNENFIKCQFFEKNINFI